MPGLNGTPVGLEAPPRPCHNCRRRRLRCDRSRPSCRKCWARGEECLGYGTVLRWANAPAVRGNLVGQLAAVKGARVKRHEADEQPDEHPLSIHASLLDPLLSHLGRKSRHYVHHCKLLIIATVMLIRSR
jgi:hypothetical protein